MLAERVGEIADAVGVGDRRGPRSATTSRVIAIANSPSLNPSTRPNSTAAALEPAARATGRSAEPVIEAGAGSDQAEPGDRVALGAQLGDRGVDPLAREVGDLEPLDDRVLAARRTGMAGRR